MKILLALDDSKYSEAAVDAVQRFASPREAEVRILCVVEPPAPPIGARDWGEIPIYVEVVKEESARALPSATAAPKA